MSLSLVGPLNSGAAVGGAGVATSSYTSTVVVRGVLLGMYVRYNDSPPAGTTDLTVKTVGTSPYAPSHTFLSISNAATDGWFYPQVVAHGTNGATLTDWYVQPVIYDYVSVTIAQADADDSVDVWLLLSVED